MEELRNLERVNEPVRASASLSMFLSTFAHERELRRDMLFLFFADFSGFWAHILCAIWELSDPLSLRDRGAGLTSGPSSSSSLWPLFMLLLSVGFYRRSAPIVYGMVFSLTVTFVAQGTRRFFFH